MSTKQHITIQIADQPRIPLTIDREDEEMVRRAEEAVNDLWRTWSMNFKDKASVEVLAMTAFRFAQLYLTLQVTSRETEAFLADFESELDAILSGS